MFHFFLKAPIPCPILFILSSLSLPLWQQGACNSSQHVPGLKMPPFYGCGPVVGPSRSLATLTTRAFCQVRSLDLMLLSPLQSLSSGVQSLCRSSVFPVEYVHTYASRMCLLHLLPRTLKYRHTQIHTYAHTCMRKFLSAQRCVLEKTIHGEHLFAMLLLLSKEIRTAHVCSPEVSWSRGVLRQDDFTRESADSQSGLETWA